MVGNGNRLDSNSFIPTNQWIHIAVSRSNSTIRMFVNGVIQNNTITSSENFTSNKLRIGANLASVSTYYKGYIDEIRLTKGIARYTSNFIPSESEFEYTPSVITISFSRLSSLLVCAPGDNPTEHKALRESVPNWEYWDSGDKFIEGTVHYNGNLAQRKVRLYRLIDGNLIRETWSDENGYYKFDRLKDQPYYVWR